MSLKFKKLVSLILAGAMAASAFAFSAAAAETETAAYVPDGEETISNNFNLHLSEGDVVKVTVSPQCDSMVVSVWGQISVDKSKLYVTDDLAAIKDDLAAVTEAVIIGDTFKQGVFGASIVESGDALNVTANTSYALDVYDFRQETPYVSATFKALDDCETTVKTTISGIYKTIVDENDVHDVVPAMDEASASVDITINGYEMGDVTNDGYITVADAIAVQRHIANLETLSGANFTLADVNYDNNLSVADAIEIQRMIAGLV